MAKLRAFVSLPVQSDYKSAAKDKPQNQQKYKHIQKSNQKK